MIGLINSYIEELFPNPVCELNYSKDYELLISVMLSAQTTDKRVNEVTSILYKKYPSLNDLSNARVEDIIEIIRPLGSFNRKSLNVIEISKRLLEDKNGNVPCDRDYLESLPGVGRKTTNVVLGELFKVPCIAVDTHVERVSKRLNLANKNDDVREVEEKLTKIYEGEEMIKKHHQLLLFGRYYCKAKNPLCEGCKLKEICTKKS